MDDDTSLTNATSSVNPTCFFEGSGDKLAAAEEEVRFLLALSNSSFAAGAGDAVLASATDFNRFRTCFTFGSSSSESSRSITESSSSSSESPFLFFFALLEASALTLAGDFFGVAAFAGGAEVFTGDATTAGAALTGADGAFCLAHRKLKPAFVL